MPGKKTAAPAWKTLLWGLGCTAALYGLGMLLCTWLTLRGTLPEGRIVWVLTGTAGLGCLAGGLVAGGGVLGPGGSLVNAGIFCAVLVLLAFGLWEGIAPQGLALLAASAAGGVGGCLVRGRRGGRRRGGRLVKTNKSRPIS